MANIVQQEISILIEVFFYFVVLVVDKLLHYICLQILLDQLTIGGEVLSEFL